MKKMANMQQGIHNAKGSWRLLRWSGLFLGALLLICGCGGGGGGDGTGGGAPPTAPLTTLSGAAAAGAPIKGMIHLRDGTGTRRSQTINDNGEFSFDIRGLTAPFLMWAEGMANAKNAFFYSMANEGGRANVTPATHCIMAMALGKNPVPHYRDNPDAALPDAAQVDAAKQKLATLFSRLFESVNVPGGFCLMTGQFACDGTAFDCILDVVDMYTDDEFVNIVDRGSSTALLKHELSTGLTVFEETPDRVNEHCRASMDVLDAARNILTTVSEQFAAELPSLADLQARVLPLMSAGFLDQGRDSNQLLSGMASGAPVGLRFKNIALYRKMKEHTFGDAAPWSIDELPSGYANGVWCTYTYRGGNTSEHTITAFVQETSGGPWKWHGDQNPFRSGGIVRAESALERSADRVRVYSGLRLKTSDTNNEAFNRFGMTSVLVLNGALPRWASATTGNTYNSILLKKDADPSTRYRIVSLTPAPRWSERYFEVDGLNIYDISDCEFVFVGADAANKTVHVWIDLLEKKPLKEAVLWKDLVENDSSSYFGEFQSIWSQPSEVYLLANDNTQIPLEFSEMPALCRYADAVEVNWQNSSNAWLPTAPGLSNPALSDSALDLASWTSATLDLSGIDPSFWPPVRGYHFIRFVDDHERWYGTSVNFTNAATPDPSISVAGYYLQFRTHRDSAQNAFRGNVEFRDLGLPVAETDISKIGLVNAATLDETPMQHTDFTSTVTYYGSWDSVDARLNFSSEPIYFSDYAGYFTSAIPAGDYYYEATTAEGDILRSPTFSYDGKVELPVVDSGSMESEWVNGGLRLSWSLPAGTFDQVRIHIVGDDPSKNDFIFLVTLPNTMSEVTISKRAIENAKLLKSVGSVQWQVTLRSRDSVSGNNYARSVSDWVVINGWN